MSQVVDTPQAPAAVGPYVQARWAGDILYTSGQIGLVPASGEMAGESLAAQAVQAMDNLGAVLQAAGLGWGDVIKTTVFLTDMGLFAEFNEIYAQRFAGAPALPARSCVAVAALPKGALVEVEAVARKG